MTQFNKEIVDRINQLKTEKKLTVKHKSYNKIYRGSINEEDGDQITRLTDLHVAFIDLFTERNKQLGEQFRKRLESEIKDLVEPEQFQNINPDEDIGFYNLNVPKEDGNDEWSVELATSYDETIFQAYFKGWEFYNLGVTH
jgi:hypothetical protein